MSPLSIRTGQETMICRFGFVRMRQMPGSRLRIFAASSNSVSIASKRLPVPPLDAIGENLSLPASRHARTVSGGHSKRQHEIEFHVVVRVPDIGVVRFGGLLREVEGFVIRDAGRLLRAVAPHRQHEEGFAPLPVPEHEIAVLWM